MRLPERPWTDLASASGHCGHIPRALAALKDPSESVRQAARWKIDNHVVLQGDLYEGAPWVACELVELLRSERDLPDRSLVLDLLVELALGSDMGRSIPTEQGQIRVGVATKEIIAEGLAVFRTHLVPDAPRTSLLAQQIIDEIEEWRRDGIIAD